MSQTQRYEIYYAILEEAGALQSTQR